MAASSLQTLFVSATPPAGPHRGKSPWRRWTGHVSPPGISISSSGVAVSSSAMAAPQASTCTILDLHSMSVTSSGWSGLTATCFSDLEWRSALQKWTSKRIADALDWQEIEEVLTEAGSTVNCQNLQLASVRLAAMIPVGTCHLQGGNWWLTKVNSLVPGACRVWSKNYWHS